MRSIYVHQATLLRSAVKYYGGRRKPIALARALILTLLGHESELCQRCGRSYDAFCWHARQSLWMTTVGKIHGLLCPRCFTKMARAAGVVPIFVAEPWIVDGKQDQELVARVWDGYQE